MNAQTPLCICTSRCPFNACVQHKQISLKFIWNYKDVWICLFFWALFGVQCTPNNIKEKQCAMNRALLFLMFARLRSNCMHCASNKRFCRAYSIPSHDKFSSKLKMGEKNCNSISISSSPHIQNFRLIVWTWATRHEFKQQKQKKTSSPIT